MTPQRHELGVAAAGQAAIRNVILALVFIALALFAAAMPLIWGRTTAGLTVAIAAPPAVLVVTLLRFALQRMAQADKFDGHKQRILDAFAGTHLSASELAAEREHLNQLDFEFNRERDPTRSIVARFVERKSS